MATWMIHLRIADLLLDALPGLDAAPFLVGSVAPDSGMPSADGTAYEPPKTVTHYKTPPGSRLHYDYERFAREYLQGAAAGRARSFYLGYYAHLLTDIAWIEDVCKPAFARYPEAFARDKYGFVQQCKGDWRDIDSLFLQAHPDFRAFRLYAQSVDFANDLVDYFAPDAFERKRREICAFYREAHPVSRRDFAYLTPAQADAFVNETASSLLPRLQRFL